MENVMINENLSPDELQHWGIKGMKWGVRRYQNKDGSLTPAGEKRRQSLGERYHAHKVNKKRKAALEKARAAKVAKKEADEKAKVEAEKREKAIKAGLIPVKKMTDAELADHLNRLNNEKRYKELQLELSPTRKLMNKMYTDAIIPGLTNAGKNVVDKYVTKTVSDYLGLDKKTKSELEKLRESQEMAKLRRQIREDNDVEYQKLKAEADKSKWNKQMLDDEHDRFFINEKLKAAKKGEVYKSPEEKEKERKAAEAKAEKERKEAEAKAEKERKENEPKQEAERRKAEAQKQVDEYNEAHSESGRYGRQYRKGTNVEPFDNAAARETGSRTVAGLLSGPTASTKTSNLPSTHVESGAAMVYGPDGKFLYYDTYKDLND